MSELKSDNSSEVKLDNSEDTDKKYEPKIKSNVEVDESGYTIITNPSDNSLTFMSPQKLHSIQFEMDLDKSEALICDLKIQHHSPVELTFLLKFASQYLKDMKVDTVYQQVNPVDWYGNLSKGGVFKLVNKNEEHNFINIICDIGELPIAIMKGLGF